MKKKILMLMLVILVSGMTYAQDTAQKTFWADPVNNPLTPFYVVLAFIFMVIIMVVFVSFTVLNAFNLLIDQMEIEKAKTLGSTYSKKPNFWSKLSQQLNDSIPVEKEGEIDLGHSYDGIRELDNHLPPWWKWLFYFTIGWAVVYIFVFHISLSLPLSQEEYQNEISQAEIQKQNFLTSQPQASIDVDKLEFTADAVILKKGKNIFIGNCVPCHKNDGGGNTIGPNLTDEYWLHGGEIKDIYTTINNGFVEKGMPAWGKVLSPSEIRDVTFFVMSLQGSNPLGAKAPQGELIKKQTIKTDSIQAQAAL